MTQKERLTLFRSLFAGQADSHGTYDVDTGEHWKEDKPITDTVILNHLNGAKPLGIYSLVGDKIKWIVVDFDNHDGENPNFAEDTIRFVNLAEKYDLPFAVEISKSGGFHTHLFFSDWVPAWKARLAIEHFLNDLHIVNAEVFPKQDRVADDKCGNFVNLPLFGKFVTKIRTVFVDIKDNCKVYPDQWEFLKKVQKVDEARLDELLQLIKLEDPKKKAIQLNMTKNPQMGWKFTKDRVDNIFKHCQALRKVEEEAKILHDLNHVKRNLLVSILFGLAPYGPERCLQILAECKDYDPIKTESYITKGTHHPWKCLTIQKYGICKGICSNILAIQKNSPIAFAYQRTNDNMPVRLPNKDCNDFQQQEVVESESPGLAKEDLLPSEQEAIKDLSPDNIRKVLLARKIFNGRIISKNGSEEKSCRRCGKNLGISWNKPLLCSECYSNLLPSEDKDKKVLEEIERKTAIWKMEMKKKLKDFKKSRRKWMREKRILG